MSILKEKSREIIKKQGKTALQHAFPCFFMKRRVSLYKNDAMSMIYFTISNNSTSNFKTLFGLISGPAARSPYANSDGIQKIYLDHDQQSCRT